MVSSFRKRPLWWKYLRICYNAGNTHREYKYFFECTQTHT